MIRKKTINIKKIIFLALIIIGIIFIFVGIFKTINYNKPTKDYVKTTGKYIGNYKTDSNNDKHQLLYSFEVDGKAYYAKTDKLTDKEPDINSEKTVRYDPNNPDKSVVGGIKIFIFWFIIGIMFLVIPLIIKLIVVKNKKIRLKNM